MSSAQTLPLEAYFACRCLPLFPPLFLIIFLWLVLVWCVCFFGCPHLLVVAKFSGTNRTVSCQSFLTRKLKYSHPLRGHITFQLIARTRTVQRFDFVICPSPPPLTVFPGIRLRHALFRKPRCVMPPQSLHLPAVQAGQGWAGHQNKTKNRSPHRQN